MALRSYISIARPAHWFKNLFMLPGTLLAAVLTQTPFSQFAAKLLWGAASVCCMASANYVINEWLDARFDRFHPTKKARAAVIGSVRRRFVFIEYGALAGAGILVSMQVNRWFAATTVLFFIMGILYNVRPFRTKERAYLDVLSESVNNPIRLALGWYTVATFPPPPSSLLLGYWATGAFLMAVKRFSELRFIADRSQAERYRSSFRSYTEENLLISVFCYGMFAAFFLGVFLVKYRIELLLSLPFIALLFSWYLRLGFAPNAVTQTPELLYRHKGFITYTICVVIVVVVLLFIDLAPLRILLNNAFVALE